VNSKGVPTKHDIRQICGAGTKRQKQRTSSIKVDWGRISKKRKKRKKRKWLISILRPRLYGCGKRKKNQFFLKNQRGERKMPSFVLKEVREDASKILVCRTQEPLAIWGVQKKGVKTDSLESFFQPGHTKKDWRKELFSESRAEDAEESQRRRNDKEKSRPM